MTVKNNQHKVIPFDEFLEDRCDTASIEWIDEQLQINGLDSAPVLQNVQRIIARREAECAECAVHTHRKPTRHLARMSKYLAKTAAVLVSIPLAFATLDISSSAMNYNVVGPDPSDLRGPQTQRARAAGGALPMFTTDEVRKQFLEPKDPPSSMTIEMFKENFFREHVPYGAIIFREARRYDLPPELVAAMVHTDSDFRTTLISRKSAQGLMQIVPDTARKLGIVDPFDPEQNIGAGTKYFRYLLDRFDSETMALAAYNAGEGNVERFGGIPPFPETRDYIVKVNRRTDRYRQRVHNLYLAAARVQSDELSVGSSRLSADSSQHRQVPAPRKPR